MVAAMASPAAGNERLSARESARAVREEIGNRWILLGSATRGSSATASVECTSMGAAKQVCEWTAANSVRGLTADGLAVVSRRQGGPVARLYAYRCSDKAGLGCL